MLLYRRRLAAHIIGVATIVCAVHRPDAAADPVAVLPETVTSVSTVSAGGVKVELTYHLDRPPLLRWGDRRARVPRIRIYANHRLAVDDPVPTGPDGYVLSFHGPDIQRASDGTHEARVEIEISNGSGRRSVFQLITYHVRRDLRTYRRSIQNVTLVALDDNPTNLQYVTQLARAGSIGVALSYYKSGGFNASPVSVQIARNGVRRAYDAIADSDGRPLSELDGPLVLDLDDDGEPEIVFTALSRGMSCCSWSIVYAFDVAANVYRRYEHGWGKYINIPEPIRIAHERDVAFVDSDEAYSGDVGNPTVLESIAPIQVWKFRRDRFVNETRLHRNLVERDAWFHWLALNSTNDRFRRRAFCAAYIGDKYTLGQGVEGWRVLRKRCPEQLWFAGAYAEISAALRRNGYDR